MWITKIWKLYFYFKGNELHSNYLNQQLTKQYQDLNNMNLGETTNCNSNNFNNYTCLENYRKNNNYIWLIIQVFEIIRKKII